MAQSGKRVLLVDADFRKPSLHKKFGISNKTGLSLVLSREVPLAEAIQETGIAGLWILPCGSLPPNPAELLTSPQFKENLDHLREQYDFVLVDTPPLLAVTDPSVVAPRVDGIILTIRVSKNGRPQAERAKEILGTLGANILGVVVNGLDRRGTTVGYEQYSYGGAYGLQEANAEYITGNKSGDEPEESAGSILEPENFGNGAGDNPVLSGNSKTNGTVKERPGSRKAGLIRRFFKLN
jgi:capsular exopolysaccharide synthesis family protein